MPEEAGIFDRAVSFTKGCYVGQETVARLHWKGKPNRRLRLLRLSGPAATGDVGAAAAAARRAGVGGGSRDAGRGGRAVVAPRQGAIAPALPLPAPKPAGQIPLG